MIIYLITHLASGKYYVGQTTRGLQRRLYGHMREARFGSTTRLHNAMRKYGLPAFTIELLATASSKAHLDSLERLFILLLCATDRSRGYNLSLGGDGCEGYRHNEAARGKMRKPHLSVRGNKQTQAHILARAGASRFAGHTHTEEAKAKCRAASRAYWDARKAAS